MVTLYGIPNCDTVRKARAWLGANGVDHAFHDFRKQGVPASHLRAWIDRLGFEALLNRRGTTLRKLGEGEREVSDAETAVALMTTHPSVIKRPVLEHGETLLVGFSADGWAAALA